MSESPQSPPTVERVFPFITGDKIRLSTWTDPDHWVRVGGYGQVYFIGEDEEGREVCWNKDAQMAYGAVWELYAPTPPIQDGYLHLQYDPHTDRYNSSLSTFRPSRSVAHGDQIWFGTFTPKERVLP